MTSNKLLKGSGGRTDGSVTFDDREGWDVIQIQTVDDTYRDWVMGGIFGEDWRI